MNFFNDVRSKRKISLHIIIYIKGSEDQMKAMFREIRAGTDLRQKQPLINHQFKLKPTLQPLILPARSKSKIPLTNIMPNTIMKGSKSGLGRSGSFTFEKSGMSKEFHGSSKNIKSPKSEGRKSVSPTSFYSPNLYEGLKFIEGVKSDKPKLIEGPRNDSPTSIEAYQDFDGLKVIQGAKLFQSPIMESPVEGQKSGVQKLILDPILFDNSPFVDELIEMDITATTSRDIKVESSSNVTVLDSVEDLQPSTRVESNVSLLQNLSHVDLYAEETGEPLAVMRRPRSSTLAFNNSSTASINQNSTNALNNASTVGIYPQSTMNVYNNASTVGIYPKSSTNVMNNASTFGMNNYSYANVFDDASIMDIRPQSSTNAFDDASIIDIRPQSPRSTQESTNAINGTSIINIRTESFSILDDSTMIEKEPALINSTSVNYFPPESIRSVIDDASIIDIQPESQSNLTNDTSDEAMRLQSMISVPDNISMNDLPSKASKPNDDVVLSSEYISEQLLEIPISKSGILSTEDFFTKFVADNADNELIANLKLHPHLSKNIRKSNESLSRSIFETPVEDVPDKQKSVKSRLNLDPAHKNSKEFFELNFDKIVGIPNIPSDLCMKVDIIYKAEDLQREASTKQTDFYPLIPHLS